MKIYVYLGESIQVPYLPDRIRTRDRGRASNSIQLDFVFYGSHLFLLISLPLLIIRTAKYGTGKCLAELPSPPTTAPSNSAKEANFFYPDYETPWANAGCKNSLPLPYNNVSDRPNYPSQLACCQNAYGGQDSGKCVYSSVLQANETSTCL